MMPAATETYLWVVNICAVVGAGCVAACALWVVNHVWASFWFGRRLDHHGERISEIERRLEDR